MSVIPERLKFTREFLLYLNVLLFSLLQYVCQIILNIQLGPERKLKTE